MIWPAIPVQNQLTIDQFYSFFETHQPSGFHFPGETHDFWECLYVLNGSVVASGDKRVYTLKAGDIIFHKPMELHKYFVESASGADLLIFSFSLEGLLADSLKNKVFSLSAFQQNTMNTLLNYVREQQVSFSVPSNALAEHHYLHGFHQNPTYSQTVVSYLCLLFLSLASNGELAALSSAPDAKCYRKAVNYMQQHISKQLSIADIAAHCNISNTTLKRLFVRFAGIGIHKYFLSLKMQAAAELLQTGHSITETAYKLGFSSQAYFSAAYKRETGKNPSELKQ